MLKLIASSSAIVWSQLTSATTFESLRRCRIARNSKTRYVNLRPSFQFSVCSHTNVFVGEGV